MPIVKPGKAFWQQLLFTANTNVATFLGVILKSVDFVNWNEMLAIKVGALLAGQLADTPLWYCGL